MADFLHPVLDMVIDVRSNESLERLLYKEMDISVYQFVWEISPNRALALIN